MYNIYIYIYICCILYTYLPPDVTQPYSEAEGGEEELEVVAPLLPGLCWRSRRLLFIPVLFTLLMIFLHEATGVKRASWKASWVYGGHHIEKQE